jgi:[ribosomal protein S18]-alanine N-acetyltransferase
MEDTIMVFRFISMNKDYAEEIAYNWKYDGQDSFYNMTEDEEDLQEFLSPKNWANKVYAALDEYDQLVGFFQYDIKNFQLEIGLGLKPELTGKGIGGSFVSAGIDFGIKSLNSNINILVLSVAAFNKRAINLYRKLGFKIIHTNMISTNGSQYEFYKMEKVLLI